MIWRALPIALAALAVAVGFRSSESPTKIDAELIRTGLAAWNKTDAQGRSCVGCHTPQGLELAFYDFDDETIMRRAEAHVSPVEAQAIVGMIHARRREHKIYKPLDTMATRPLQPGGEVLTGETSADRDFAFAREVDRRAPLLTRGVVDSLKKARKAADEVLAIDLRHLPVGFAFNRLSEDGFHGTEHATIADWIPDTPVKLSQQAVRARDAYQSEPSSEHLNDLIAKLPKASEASKVAENLSLAKYGALLRLSAQMAHPNLNELGPRRKYDSPFWDLGEIARISGGLPLNQLGFPDDIRLKKEPGPPIFQQFKSMKLPWYWAAWMSDPGLQHTSMKSKSRIGVYFGFTLFEEGPYPMHCAFMFFRKQLAESFDPSSWTRLSPQHYVMDFTSFLASGNYLTYAPKSPKAASLYLRFVANAYRTSLYLLLDETNRTHMTDLQLPALGEARQMADFIEAQDPKSKRGIETLLEQIRVAFSHAKQMQS